ncbi:rhomboid family intramembrane serine protease [Pseudahrensia aquimaris]|uniref:Rhomboid family intramembrane serine protease n=1 Tax=Pseudahrensia aquimaris TaxID=744461 RepID=A0ABW3FGS5_9HYPH
MNQQFPHDEPTETQEKPNEPAFNLPTSVLVVSLALIAVHAISQFLSRPTYFWVIEMFAFIPAAYWVSPSELLEPLTRFWSPVSYFFLHGDWVHLIANLIWFAAFGSAVARRFGTARFFTFLVLSTAASALAHFAFNATSASPVIGASGAVSACMGAAVRFGFAPNDPRSGAMRPSMSLLQSLSNPGILIFVVIWFAFNWLFGAGVVPMPGVEGQIAWEAHMGGFLFGLLAFAPFDPVGQRRTYLS